MTVAIKRTKHPYISIDPKISGGQPVISGTRISVMDIAIRYELMGMSVDEIVDEYPHLKLEQIPMPFPNYYEHKEMFDKKYLADQLLIKQLKRQHPSRLKAKLG